MLNWVSLIKLNTPHSKKLWILNIEKWRYGKIVSSLNYFNCKMHVNCFCTNAAFFQINFECNYELLSMCEFFSTIWQYLLSIRLFAFFSFERYFLFYFPRKRCVLCHLTKTGHCFHAMKLNKKQARFNNKPL